MFSLIFFGTVTSLLRAPFDIRIDHQKVETSKDLIVYRSQPRFSWKSTDISQQIAYQFQIRSLWDSDQVFSSASTHVNVFDGRYHLEERRFYQFRLRLWSNQSRSEWTQWISFRTSVFDPRKYFVENRHRPIFWIGSEQINMNELRKEFQLNSTNGIRSAIVILSGVGYYELEINGKPVDPTRKLDPGWTTYERRILLVNFDVTSFIEVGTNVIGVRLGQGWYSREQFLLSQPNGINYGSPRLFFWMNITLLNNEEVHVYSDLTWKGRQGSIRHDSIFNGEIRDARDNRPHWTEKNFTDPFSLWLPPEILPSPLNETLHGQMSFQQMPPIRVGPDALHVEITKKKEIEFLRNGLLKPIRVSKPVRGIHILDVGQNMAGWCRIRFQGARGISVQIRYAELLSQPVVSTGRASGGIYTENLRSATQTDTYILRGDPTGEVYEPRFTVHGFRYLSVFGSPNDLHWSDIECPVVHSETSLKGHFSTSNPVINQIQQNIQWGQLNNLMSLPTDCPQRDERKGWLGDAALTVDEALYNFDLIQFYQNFLQSIVDIQRSDGSIPDTVPLTSGDYPADPNWGTALPTITWQLYRHYQDFEILQIYYPFIRSYIESVRDGYNRTGLIDLHYHYGDWVPPPPAPMTNVHLVSSFAFLHDIEILIHISEVLKLNNDTESYRSFYQHLAEEFHRVFFNWTGKFYADGMQSAQILALALPNVVPDDQRQIVLDHLVNDIREKNVHLTTGIISTAQLFPVLSDNGYHDLAVELISSITYPSYGYMFNNPYENATTLWELWDAPFEDSSMNSRNHIMFGSVGAWFYSHLVGIDYQSDLIVIRPRMVSEAKKQLLSKVHCQLSTIYGLVEVSYTRDESETFANSIRLTVDIPSNSRARVIFEPLFPRARCVMLTENDEILWSTFFPDERTQTISVDIRSGHHDFQVFWILSE